LRIVDFSTVPEGIAIIRHRSLATGAGEVNRRAGDDGIGARITFHGQDRATGFLDQTVIARTQDRNGTLHAAFQGAGRRTPPGPIQGNRMAKRDIEAGTTAAGSLPRIPSILAVAGEVSL
jgi:hypothetical protein